MVASDARRRLGIPVAVTAEPDAVLLGAAMLGATAAGVHPSLDACMGAMTRLVRVVEPDLDLTRFHDAKYRVYRQMIDDQITYHSIMNGY